MQALSAKKAKYGFGHIIDFTRIGPVEFTKHARSIVMLASNEKCDWLMCTETVSVKTAREVSRGAR